MALPLHHNGIQLGYKHALALILISAGLLWLIWHAHQAGRASVVLDNQLVHDRLAHARTQVKVLSRKLVQHQDTNSSLIERVANAERGAQVDKAAVASLRTEFGNMQSEIAELKQQLVFYRDIVDQDRLHNSLQLHSFEVQPQQASGLYRYQLLIIQTGRRDRKVAGHLTLTVHGTQDGKAKKLEWKRVRVPKPKGNRIGFKLRYFKSLEGDLVLPSDFTPNRVEAVLKIIGDADSRVRSSFPWTELIAEGSPQ